MASALKCDRCKNYFDYDPEVKNNFIAFGHKDIIIGKNFPVKDICPNCMKEFEDWNFDKDTCKRHICGICDKFSVLRADGEPYQYSCAINNKSIPAVSAVRDVRPKDFGFDGKEK